MNNKQIKDNILDTSKSLDDDTRIEIVLNRRIIELLEQIVKNTKGN
jgi:hypothetical protein